VARSIERRASHDSLDTAVIRSLRAGGDVRLCRFRIEAQFPFPQARGDPERLAHLNVERPDVVHTVRLCWFEGVRAGQAIA
jgi:hypothetical protein